MASKKIEINGLKAEIWSKSIRFEGMTEPLWLGNDPECLTMQRQLEGLVDALRKLYQKEVREVLGIK